MFKKIDSWVLYLFIIIFFIIIILYGSLLRHQILGGEKFSKISRIALFISEIPSNTKKIIFPKYDLVSKKHKNKKKITSNNPVDNDLLLLLSRYSPKKNKFVVEIIDIKKFKVLHQYEIVNRNEINKYINDKKEFKDFNNRPFNKYIMKSPLILEDGSIIFQLEYGPLVRKNFCGDIMWINYEDLYHHYISKYKDDYIFVPSSKYPYSDTVKKYRKNFGFKDDSITKLNLDGKIIFQKSLIEILKDNSLFSESLFKNDDPIHLNKIEPVLEDTKYFEKDDLFLSSPALSAIIHYRPSTNKVVNYLVGEFSLQHDVDVVSDKEISIFNNNQYGKDTKYSEILIYNFETKKFTKKLKDQLEKNNFKTKLQGLHQILSNGSIFLEETIHGRILFFNNEDKLYFEYVNKYKNNSYMLGWSSIIDDKKLIKKILNLIDSKKCKKFDK